MCYFDLMHLIFSTLSSLGSQSEILRVKASDDIYERIGRRFKDDKLEKEKNS